MAHRVADGPMTVQRIEHRNAVRTADDRLAVEDERRGSKLGCGVCDRRIATSPVVATPREKPHGVADPANLEAISIVLDLMDPVGPYNLHLDTRLAAVLDCGQIFCGASISMRSFCCVRSSAVVSNST